MPEFFFHRKRIIRLHPCNSNWKRKNKHNRGSIKHIQSLSNLDENEDSDYESEIFADKQECSSLKKDQDPCKWEFMNNQIKNKQFTYSQHPIHEYCETDSASDLKCSNDKRW